MSGTLPVVTVISDPAVRRALGFHLAAYGFIVSSWQDCRSPPSSAEILLCSCIVMECHLPTLDGIEVIVSLRREGCRVPAILLVEQVSAEIEKRAAALYACDLVKLPFFGATLKSAIDEVCDLAKPFGHTF